MRAPSPILIAAFGVFCGCVIDALIKGLSADINVLVITLWRFVFGALYSSALYLAARKPRPSAAAWRFHTMRGAIQVVAALAFFYALTQLGLAEATVLGFTAALMIAPIAWIILGEKLNGLSVLAAFVGFGGAALAVWGSAGGGPEDGNRVYGVAAVLIAALAYAAAVVLLRLRTRTEDSLTIVMFSNVMPALILVGIALIIETTSVGRTVQFIPDLVHVPLLATIGLFGMGIWWMFTLAYARAPAQRLAPLEYTALIWASILGYFFFEETPGWPLFAGAAIIIGACMIVAFESRFSARKEAGLPTSDILD
ncbi:MAG: DMT family transporter [Pseudomonadota bacterium]